MSLLPSSTLLSAELLKVRKRWILYVIFLAMVAGTVIQIWLIGYLSWIQEQDEAEFEFGLDAARAFVWPYSLATLLDSGQFWGAILIGILTSSVVGTEYGWGTVRQAILRGQSRSGFLTLKLAGIIVLSASALLLALAVGIAFSAMAGAIADVDVDLGDSLSVGEGLLMVLRAGYGIVPYGMLAFALTTIGRSTTLGVAGTLMYIIVESILIAIFGSFSWGEDLRAFFPGYNAQALLAANYFDNEQSFYSMAPREAYDRSELPEPAMAALVLTLYSLALAAVTYYVFNRRDLGR